MKVHFYGLCWNEAPFLSFFLRHYAFCERVVFYDHGSTDGTPDLLRAAGVEVRSWQAESSACEEAARLKATVWHESRGAADWVIVADMDEFLFHPHMQEYLAFLSAHGYTAAQATGYDMIAADFPAAGPSLPEVVRTGNRSPMYDKCCLFDPDQVTEVWYSPGCHAARLGGAVRVERQRLKLLHYRYLGRQATFDRYRALGAKLPPADAAKGYGAQYYRPFEQFAAEFDALLERGEDVVARPVPGLETRRYLFGPVRAGSGGEHLGTARADGSCLTFGHGPEADLTVPPEDTWEQICARLPAGWGPDFVALALPVAAVPRGVWSAPVPLVALAEDWDLHWHAYRRLLRRCELVLADTAGAEALAREGVSQVQPINLCGCDPSLLEAPLDEGPRDIDVLFVGSLYAAKCRARLPWLGRLARLAERRRVVIATGASPAEERALLRRARIVFNHGACDRRTFSAAAAGALLFQEADSRELQDVFADRRECVLYTGDDLEALLEHYLNHEDERRALAEAARLRVRDHTAAARWQQALDHVAAHWDELIERVGRRPASDAREELLSRTWVALGAAPGSDPSLPAELGAAVAGDPGSAPLTRALGVAEAFAGAGPAAGARAAEHFWQALRLDDTDAVTALNLAEALLDSGRRAPAAEVTRLALGRLDRCTDEALRDGLRYPPGHDLFRVEWERAAWDHAGDLAGEARAKRHLLAWRFNALRADLTGDLRHFEAAAAARPDLPVTQAALGCAQARAGRLSEAVAPLRAAVAANPFDLPAARALFQVLGDTGDAEGAAAVARNCRLLAHAAPGAIRLEPWFAAGPPAGELASLVILCCNELDVTRLCLESVLRHTRAPYELILIDNGSSDGTPAYLDALRERPGPVRVAVIHNAENRGFAAGCNQGIAAARGRCLVFLNNDTVVTPGWLEGLTAWTAQGGPATGLVGAVSNYAAPPQQVEPGYADLGGLDAFAARRRAAFAGQALDVPRLTGFCLLVCREVLDRVGGFDEGYGLGFFEDDDLCVRARRAGFGLRVALGVYIHHFGSRTFTGLGVDTGRALLDNFATFKAKWGPAEAAPYSPPGENGVPSPPALGALPDVVRSLAPGAAAPRVSLCLIVKNEEKNLPNCLGSAADLVDEVVVVDTGSTDRTRDIAARFGARVIDFPWVDNFAAARNESIRHAAGKWIFWLDADDRLDEDNRARVRALLATLPDENAAYCFKCLCLPEAPGATATVVDHLRLFRNRPDVRWMYRVHEQIMPAVRRSGAEVRWSDVVVQHTGYQDPALRGRKLERDLRLLLLEDAENPDDPFTLFNLGLVYRDQGRFPEALAVTRRSLARSDPQDSIVRKLYALLADGHSRLGQPEEALAACREGRGHYPDDAELLFLEANLRKEQKDLAGAEHCLVTLLESRPVAHFASVADGLRGYKARQNLGAVYKEQGRLAEAERQWKLVTAERPDFLLAWLCLGDLYLAQGRWPDLEAVADQMHAHPVGAMEATTLRARGLLSRREFAAARGLLEETVARNPGALYAWLILSHVLLQEGRDPAAAEKALRTILTLEPGHAEATNNLSVLLHRRRQDAADVLFAGNLALAQRYEEACLHPSELHEHLPTLYALARECRHVTQMGARGTAATAALLYARPARLVCYDRMRRPEVEQLLQLADGTEFDIYQEDVLAADIEDTDLLFIDTRHVYEQLKEELRRHAGKVRRYIVLTDTTTFAEQGESAGHRGVWPAVAEFLRLGTFRLKQRFHNNNGLTVLEAVGTPGK